MTMTTTMNKRRNFGIVAHVDAGKTTVSERILHCCGAIRSPGEVHHGASAMDVDPRERAHGITISAAATTVRWKDHDLTLIDTPGHIDFNVEVKRSLRVLDGAVVVFDAVAGVEPQSETNWRLADEFGLPRVVFINKMDRPGADFARTLDMIESQLGAHCIPVQLPVGAGPDFEGLLCPFTHQCWTWTGVAGEPPNSQAIPSDQGERLDRLRDHLIEIASSWSDEVLHAWIDEQPISHAMLEAAIRRAVLEGGLVPVLCGSALRNSGVEPLLDALVSYLPTPEERPWDGPEDPEAKVLYAFKSIATDHGALTYCRLYQGSVKPKDRLFNTSTDRVEQVGACYRMHADQRQPLTCAVAGDIVTISGLKHTSTGQTLCSPGLSFALEALSYPEPVATVALELPNSEARDKVVHCLDRIRKDDPTLRVSSDAESGQLLLSGIGELHLEVVREELERVTGVALRTGAPIVSYRETITRSAEVRYLHKKQTGGPGERAEVLLRLEPRERGSGFTFTSKVTGGNISPDLIPSVEKGVKMRLISGIREGYPVVDVAVTLIDGAMHANDSSPRAFQVAAAEATAQALREGKSILLEPLMDVEIRGPESALGAVMGDLARRRGSVQHQELTPQGQCVIHALVPLKDMFGYANALRSLSSGRASFAMEFSRYDRS